PAFAPVILLAILVLTLGLKVDINPHAASICHHGSNWAAAIRTGGDKGHDGPGMLSERYHAETILRLRFDSSLNSVSSIRPTSSIKSVYVANPNHRRISASIAHFLAQPGL